jgi:hypothetical protein
MGIYTEPILSALGGYLGSRWDKSKKNPNRKWKETGTTIGSVIGSWIPKYKKGGKVPKTQIALLHKNEFVLPSSVKPTKAQKKKVRKLKYV